MVQSSHITGATKSTVLVIDDSTTMRSMVQSFLPQDEFQVQVAKSGQEGLARIQEHCPDVLLLDFIMPGMNGYEVYTRLREQPKYADLPIVIMSGSKVEVFNKFAESKIEQKFVFMSKPFDPETLRKQIILAIQLRLIPTTIEDIIVQEELHLNQPALSHETVFADELAVVKDEPKIKDEAMVNHDVLPREVFMSEEIVVNSKASLKDETVLPQSHDLAEMPIAQVPMVEKSLEPIYYDLQIEELPTETTHTDETVRVIPSYESAEMPIAQIPVEAKSFDYVHELPVEKALVDETMHSQSHEAVEIPRSQIPVEANSFAYGHKLLMDEPEPVSETMLSLNPETAEGPMAQIPVEAMSLEHIHKMPIETTLDDKTSEKTSKISEAQVSTEAMSLDYIYQNLAHILQTETYVMGALQNLDERVAKDMHSIESLVDHTALLQQEFMQVRTVLHQLNQLPKHFEALKEQVLTQPQISQAYLDGSKQEHLMMVGDRFNQVDSTLMQSVVTLDRLEEIQTGLGETINTSYGQLSDRLTAIERRFEAIVVRPPDPVAVVAAPKSYVPPLLYITIALGALNFGAMVALLLR